MTGPHRVFMDPKTYTHVERHMALIDPGAAESRRLPKDIRGVV